MRKIGIGVVLFVLLVSSVVYSRDLDSRLIYAAYKGDVATVKALLGRGADVNAKDEFGRTALMWAANGGNAEVVEVLIDKGADVNVKTKEGWTALMWARERGHTEIVEMLKQEESYVGQREEDYVVQKGCIEVEDVQYESELYPFRYKLMLGGKKSGLVKWKIRNLCGHWVDVRLTCEVQDWSSENIIQEIILSNESIEIYQTPKFKDKLFENVEIREADLLLRVDDVSTNETTYKETRSMTIFSSEDIVWRELGQGQNKHIAMFVTPRDMAIQEVFTKARYKAPGGIFNGYRGDVRAQMRAIFNTLDEMGFYYVSRARGSSGVAQRITLPGNSVKLKHGNCVDGTLLYASLFEAIELEPVIVLTPRHMFVGIRKSPGSNEVIFLETTLTGRKRDLLTVLEELGSSILSLGTETPFERAVSAGDEQYRKHYYEGNFEVIDIKRARDEGISPMR